MAIADVMSRQLVTVTPDETVAEAARQLHVHQASAVVVIEGDAPVGIITERDIVQLVVDGQNPETTPVRGRMTTQLHTLPSAADEDEAGQLMAKYSVRHVPVVDEGRLVGIVSLGDPAMVAMGPRRRPVTDFGTTATVTHFKGPYADGPPACSPSRSPSGSSASSPTRVARPGSRRRRTAPSTGSSASARPS
jgi:CBS domain-containing protein